jgi:hypothetical protein
VLHEYRDGFADANVFEDIEHRPVNVLNIKGCEGPILAAL